MRRLNIKNNINNKEQKEENIKNLWFKYQSNPFEK